MSNDCYFSKFRRKKSKFTTGNRFLITRLWKQQVSAGISSASSCKQLLSTNVWFEINWKEMRCSGIQRIILFQNQKFYRRSVFSLKLQNEYIRGKWIALGDIFAKLSRPFWFSLRFKFINSQYFNTKSVTNLFICSIKKS